jgi:hypothetical protein
MLPLVIPRIASGYQQARVLPEPKFARKLQFLPVHYQGRLTQYHHFLHHKKRHAQLIASVKGY